MFPEWLKEWAWREVAEVKRAKAAFGVLAVLASLAGWFAAQKFYAERIEVLQQQVAAGRVLTVPAAPAAIPSQPIYLIPSLPLPYAMLAGVVIAAIGFSAWRSSRVVRKLRAQDAAKTTVLEAESALNTKLTEDLARAKATLKDTKETHAIECLERYSKLRFYFQEGIETKTRVTIRYASYNPADYELVQRLNGLFTQYLKWPVHLDGTNNPALTRANNHKIEFDLGQSVTTYHELVGAFMDLLDDVRIKRKAFTDRAEDGHLIVSVLPE